MKSNPRTRTSGKLIIITACLLAGLLIRVNVKAEETPEQQAITMAQNWLQSERQADGSWSTGKRTLMDTMTTLEHMEELTASQLSYLDALQLQNNHGRSMWLSLIGDDTSRIDEIAHLFESQNPDGGWGLEDKYQSNLMDTIIVMNTIIKEENINEDIIRNGVEYILSKQKPEGSWTVYGNDEMSVGITARTLILLDMIQELKLELSTENYSVATSISKGSSYLISQKNETTWWGMDEDGIRAAKAIMITKGLEPLEGLAEALLTIQEENGSWVNKPGLTAMIMDWLRCKSEVESTVIESVILKHGDTATGTFKAHEEMTIETTAEYDQEQAELRYYLKSAEGVVRELEGNVFNTGKTTPGDYTLTVKLRDKNSGTILATKEVSLIIETTFNIQDMKFSLSPEFVKVGRQENIQITPSFNTISNIDEDIVLVTRVSEGGVTKKEIQTSHSCTKDKDSYTINTYDFYPDVSVTREYLVEIIVMVDGVEMTRVQRRLPVLPLSNNRTMSMEAAPGERIDENIQVPLRPAVEKTDIILAYDQSTLMKSGIGTAKARGKSIITELKNLGEDIRYSLISYEDYPIYNNGNTYYPDYLMRKALTSDTVGVSSAIDNIYSVLWSKTMSQDYSRMLYETYSDPALGIREDSRKIIVNFGVNVPHDDNVNEGVPGKTGVFNTGVDPGRDKLLGTADDLDFQTVLEELGERNITLMASQYNGNHLDYWTHWSSLTGGKAYDFMTASFASDLVNDIKSLIKESEIGGLKLVPVGGETGWVVTDEMDDYTGPGDVLAPLDIAIEVPSGTPVGSYQIILNAVDKQNRNHGTYTIQLTVAADQQ